VCALCGVFDHQAGKGSTTAKFSQCLEPSDAVCQHFWQQAYCNAACITSSLMVTITITNICCANAHTDGPAKSTSMAR